MLSKAQVKDIRGLATAKGRKAAGAFVAEGDKIVREWLTSGKPVQLLAATSGWLEAHQELVSSATIGTVIPATPDDLLRISSLSTPQPALIVAGLPTATSVLPTDEWTIALDDIQDPGNMGTIIRIADWFGIRHVVASPPSADFYNAKVVQAAMGAHLRVSLHKAALPAFLAAVKMPVIAAALDGEHVYGLRRLEKAVLVIGNESRGISEEVKSHCNLRVSIPKRGGAESLNAAVSAGILCALLLPG